MTPDPVTFETATARLESRVVLLRNTGSARLIINDVRVDPLGNPDFSVVALTPMTLSVGESRGVEVVYSRSKRANQGGLKLLSNAPTSPTTVALVPKPVGRCGDRLDNDGDGVTDFPDDPGCADFQDDDEVDPPSCIDGANQVCGTDVGDCLAGMRTCASSRWGACLGAVDPVGESCDGRDNNCNGSVDEGLLCAVDAGALDAGALDAGAIDAGALDAGAIDAGALDAGCRSVVTRLAGSPITMGPFDGFGSDAGLRRIESLRYADGFLVTTEYQRARRVSLATTEVKTIAFASSDYCHQRSNLAVEPDWRVWCSLNSTAFVLGVFALDGGSSMIPFASLSNVTSMAFNRGPDGRGYLAYGKGLPDGGVIGGLARVDLDAGFELRAQWAWGPTAPAFAHDLGVNAAGDVFWADDATGTWVFDRFGSWRRFSSVVSKFTLDSQGRLYLSTGVVLNADGGVVGRFTPASPQSAIAVDEAFTVYTTDWNGTGAWLNKVTVCFDP